jgi:anti-sigma28 factor (negative regulator of flagellin synthesis)
LQIGLFNATTRTQLAYQNTFDDDTGASKKTGTLALNTAAINTALTNADQLRCVFEVRTEDGTGPDYPYRNKSVQLIRAYITSGTLTVPPGETAATESWSKALFVPKDGSNSATPCDQIIIKSRPSGLTKVLWWDDDGVAHVENP